jgi:hypothetical protein
MLAPKITTHVADATSRLLSQYSDSPRIVALVQAIVSEIQTLEEAIYGIDDGRSLFGHPVGAQLDRLGELIGVARNGLSDASYLSVLRGAIAEDNSDGTSRTVVGAAAALFEADAIFRKDSSSIGAWPSLGVIPAIPAPPYVPPGGAVISTLSLAMAAGVSGSIYIQSADWAGFAPGGYIVVEPASANQESFLFYSRSSPNIITPNAGFLPFQRSHPAGAAVYYAPTSMDIPAPGIDTPASITTLPSSSDLDAVIALGIGSAHIDPVDYPVVQAMLMASVPAGVGVFYLSLFNAAGCFACAGPQAWVQGWGDANDPSVGGFAADLLFHNPSL